MIEILTKWRGKSPEHPDGVAHPAVYHMLDVAAVSEQFQMFGGLTPPHAAALHLLAALHDLGKIGHPFQKVLNGERHAQVLGRHWEMTEVLLLHHDNILAEKLGHRALARASLYAAAAGPQTQQPGQKAERVHPRDDLGLLAAA